MPAKSGVSHALAAFLSIILGTVISNFLGAHTELLNNLSEGVGVILTGLTGMSLPEEVTGLLVVSTLLAFLWGVAYHYARHSSEQTDTRPKNYITDNQQSKKTEQMSKSAAVGNNLLNTEQADSYQQLQTAREADETLRSELTTDLGTAKSALDGAHDRLYDADKRESAERAKNLAKSIVALERTVTHAPVLGQNHRATTETDVLNETIQRDLATTHDNLSSTVTNLVETAEEIQRRPVDTEDTVFDECEVLVQNLEQTVHKRIDIIKQFGEKNDSN